MAILTIAFIAGKGGTGKTTHCAICTQILLEEGNYPNIVGVDLDPQRDLTARIGHIVPIYTSLAEIPKDAIALIDGAPGVIYSDNIITAIKTSTILIIPARGDQRSVQAATTVYELRRTATDKPTKILFNEYTQLSREKQAIKWLSENFSPQDLHVFPRIDSLITNLDLGRRWAIGLQIKKRNEIKDFYTKLLKIQ
jgi:cellulose biosynthesis protein BcsQ